MNNSHVNPILHIAISAFCPPADPVEPRPDPLIDPRGAARWDYENEYIANCGIPRLGYDHSHDAREG